MSETYKRIKAGLREAIEYANGNTEGAVVHHFETPAINVRSIRQKTGMTQTVFASRFGFGVRSLQNWEQGRRQPSRTAYLMLRMIDAYPAEVERVVSGFRPSSEKTMRIKFTAVLQLPDRLIRQLAYYLQ